MFQWHSSTRVISYNSQKLTESNYTSNKRVPLTFLSFITGPPECGPVRKTNKTQKPQLAHIQPQMWSEHLLKFQLTLTCWTHHAWRDRDHSDLLGAEWELWGTQRHEEEQFIIFNPFWGGRRKRRADVAQCPETMKLLSRNRLWHRPAEEAGEGQADRVAIADHVHHIEHTDVLQLGGHMEAVKCVRLTAGVGAHALHEVRGAILQFTHHLWQRVLWEKTVREETAFKRIVHIFKSRAPISYCIFCIIHGCTKALCVFIPKQEQQQLSLVLQAHLRELSMKWFF